MTHLSLKTALLTATTAAALTLGGCKENTRSTAPGAPAPSSPAAAPANPAPAPTTPAPSTTESRASDMLTGASSVTVQQAKEFLELAAKDLETAYAFSARAAWVKANFITEDTAWLETKANTEATALLTRLAADAKRFNSIKLPADMARKMDMLKRSSNFPAPNTPGAAEELSKIMTSLDSAYGTGKFSYRSPDPQFASFYEGLPEDEVPALNLEQLSQIIAKSRDPQELQTVWEGWRTIARPMAGQYARMVEIINAGSRELGYADTADLWRAGYDMPADEFTIEADRLWGQVKPLYDELHCYARAELNKEYGDDIVPLDQPIRADLMGNMWAQSWGNIYDIVAPELPAGVKPAKTVDVTALLEAQDYDALKMVQTAEVFFTSMGFAPLPETFWERSLITRPQDREVVCHASAWNIDDKDDVRIKMCTQVTEEDFKTVHHELGHNFYQRAYKDQPVYYRTGANDGFHEAIGDMISLSITPDYLVQIGLLDADDVPSADGDTDLLLRQALEKVAFMPFGLMVDQWRWKVFSGEIAPDQYNAGWWELREKYQGIRPPAERPAGSFDPGAKYHIPGNTPYTRYFLAHILQFQFHKAACEIAEYEGPLHRCSVYNNKEVGARFDAMMKLGASRPWQDALEAFTGTREMDGSAMLQYFEPLMVYLQEENEGRACGWQ